MVIPENYVVILENYVVIFQLGGNFQNYICNFRRTKLGGNSHLDVISLKDLLTKITSISKLRGNSKLVCNLCNLNYVVIPENTYVITRNLQCQNYLNYYVMNYRGGM